jgi:AcrR family transcriptional regulator
VRVTSFAIVPVTHYGLHHRGRLEAHLNTEPITPKGRRTRIRILDAARQVLARTGYVTLRMADVAAQAGLSMGALYRYFGNKEDLFDNLIGDIHQDLYLASNGGGYSLADDPYKALLSANRGYLSHYYENRDVLRVLVEVMTVDTRFRDIWWAMRQRHINRFLKAYRAVDSPDRVSDEEASRLCEALSAMVEMSAYAWFAQEDLNSKPVSIDQAAETVTRIWHDAFFKARQPAGEVQSSDNAKTR